MEEISDITTCIEILANDIKFYTVYQHMFYTS